MKHRREEISGKTQSGASESQTTIAERTEHRWRHLEAELRSLLDAVGEGVLLLDLAGKIRYANAQLAQLFFLDARSLERLESFDELNQLLIGRFRQPELFSLRWKNAQEDSAEPHQDELELLQPKRRLLERFSRPVEDSSGRRMGWLETYRDITQQRQIQFSLLQTEKMVALGQLVSGIAHELNNPLTSIMGYAQLLLGHARRPHHHSEAEKIYQEAERARRIVKNLLLFAREDEPERTRVDLNEIVERTLALRSYELKIQNIEVECDLAPDMPATMADPHQLQQVVLNLLVNAEQALLEGRGHGHVRMATRRSGPRRIALEVMDDGPGMPPDVQRRIFDPFFTTKPPGVGTGLGLSIVYGIVQQHGGDVHVVSSVGTGAKFTIDLPVLSVSDVASTHRDLPLGAGERRSAAPGRILVVEDEPTVGQLIVDVLAEEGHRADFVMESQEGLARLSKTHYDLVVCDLRMPRLDGPAMYDALVRAGSPLQQRILFITGDTLSRRTHQFLKKHRLPFLAKPFLVEELKLAVSRLLDGSSSARLPPEMSREEKTPVTSRHD